VTFFNKKEEVLDVQLTQLGKYLLSKGKLRPAYYVFSDDEILYDVHYVSGTPEKQKETSNRIQRETQRLRTMYEHDGVESRVMALNGHNVDKPRGLGWQAKVRGRTEELPFDQAYGTDTVEQEKMGSDDRNLVRNILGNSSIGDQSAPTWDVESMSEGQIESINISSSSPNIGIKRPVLNFEVNYAVEGRELSPTEVRQRDGLFNNVSDEGELFQHEFDLDSPLSRKVNFLDNFEATISNGTVILSIIEDNVDYDLQNFEFEFYEIETTSVNNSANDATTEQLRKLFFSSDTGDDFIEADLDGPDDRRYVEHYYDIETDFDLANTYSVEINGTNPFKVRREMQASVSDFFAAARKLDARLGADAAEQGLRLRDTDDGECD
jgi:hypothetical protein